MQKFFGKKELLSPLSLLLALLLAMTMTVTAFASADASATPSSVDFSSEELGYQQPDWTTITIENTGDVEFATMAITIEGSNPEAFEFDEDTLASIDGSPLATTGVTDVSERQATIKVRPVAGLGIAEYSATLTVGLGESDPSDKEVEIELSFEVTDAEEDAESGDVTVADILFGSLQAPYAQPQAKPVVVTNNGETEITVSEVEIDNDTDFILATSGVTNTVATGATTNIGWTVQPKANLMKGDYEATITVTHDGEDGSSEATVSFTVTQKTVVDDPKTDTTTPNANNNDTGSGGSSGGGGGGGGSSVNTPVTSPNVSANGSVNTTTVTTELKQALNTVPAGGTAVVSVKNADNITAAAIQSLAKAAQSAGKEAVVHADTVGADGAIQGRLYLDVSKLAGISGDIKLGVSTQGARTENRKSHFEKFFNNKVSVVSCAQQGSFGAKLKIAAKVKLPANTESLSFYSYDAKTNTFKKIDTTYRIDKNGFIHFETELAGDIIISDKPLVRK